MRPQSGPKRVELRFACQRIVNVFLLIVELRAAPLSLAMMLIAANVDGQGG